MSDSLHLSPLAFSVLFSQATSITNSTPTGNRFDLGDSSDYFKIHESLV